MDEPVGQETSFGYPRPVEERVLLVEDDHSIRLIVAKGLQQSGFRVATEGDGRLGLIRFRQETFDALLLDVMLPSLNGFEICRQVRSDSFIPIIMLTARNETGDVVLGLEAGADDYLTKPFEIEELVARLRAALRRARLNDGQRLATVGPLEIDIEGFKVSKSGMPLTLTATEFKLLVEFVQNTGRVLTREMLLDAVWDYDYLGDSRIVDMAVKRLREKIEDDPGHPQLVQTVRGVGYRLEA